jgi:solute carrier family 25 citrate transporter 1
METIKVKLIHDRMQSVQKYKGLVHGVRTIVAEEGILSSIGPHKSLRRDHPLVIIGLRGIYRGLLPTIVKQGSNQAIRFVTFAEVKKWMQGGPESAASLRGDKLHPTQSLMAGVIAGATSVLGNNPVDVVKSRMQGFHAAQYKSTMDCFMQILQKEGVRAFVAVVSVMILVHLFDCALFEL